MIGNSGINGDYKGLPFLNWQVAKHASSAFTGNTPGTHGDSQSGGTAKPTYTIWTVTGDIMIMSLWGIVNTTTTGVATATIEIGVVGNTDFVIATTTGTDLLDGGVLNNASPTVGIGSSTGVLTNFFINDGANIIETTKTEDMDDGQIDYYMIWSPVEPGATVVEAGTLS